MRQGGPYKPTVQQHAHPLYVHLPLLLPPLVQATAVFTTACVLNSSETLARLLHNSILTPCTCTFPRCRCLPLSR